MKKLSHKFKNKRKSLGITLEQVSSDIKVNKKHIYIFETGDFNEDLKNIYIAGFIKSYAAYLRLDSDEMLDIYKKNIAELAETKKTQSKYKEFFKPKTSFFNQGERIVKSNKIVNIICLIVLIFSTLNFTKKNLEYQIISSNIVNSIIHKDFNKTKSE